jgi:PPOX class probable F420-dependent enzyme
MGPDGYPHAVPVCFAVVGGDVVTAIDQKPKSGRRLARLRNVEERGAATLLFDRWDEDWRRLGWVMIGGGARIEPPGTAAGELSARYAQYRDDPPAGESIVVSPHRIRWWTWR